MKKLLLGALLLLSISTFAQETFVKKYTSFVSKENDVLQPWVTSATTVVFNANNENDVIFYYANGNTRKFYQIGNVQTGATIDSNKYQLIECIDQDGSKVTLQLFDDDTCLRVIIAKGYIVEFHRD